jgi:hypothetical protein
MPDLRTCKGTCLLGATLHLGGSSPVLTSAAAKNAATWAAVDVEVHRPHIVRRN